MVPLLTKDDYKPHLVQIAKDSVPLVVSFSLQYISSIVPIFIVGHIGSVELSSASLAIMTFNITGLAITQGCVSSLDTLAAQAYGAKNYHMVGIYSQKCAMMIILALIPFSFMWWFSEPILNGLQPQKELSALAQTYLRLLIPGVPALVVFEAEKRFLQAQKIMQASTYVLLLITPLSFVLNYMCVMRLGFMGAPLAVSITYWALAILLGLYILFVDGSKCWAPITRRGLFSHYGPMAKLAGPGIVMVIAEYLAFEIMTVLSSYFGSLQMASQSIASSVASITFQLTFAFSVAAGTSVAQLVGEGHIKMAKKVSEMVVSLSLFIGCVLCALLLISNRFLVGLFTNDETLRRASSGLIVLLAINQILDAANVLSAGVLRGVGRQKAGSICNLVSYYLVGLPLAYFLAFKVGLEVRGLWMGLMTGVAVLALSQVGVVVATDWGRIEQEARERCG